jgi:hypothetical protein
MNDELEMLWQEEASAQFKALSMNLLEGSEKNYKKKKPQSG